MAFSAERAHPNLLMPVSMTAPLLRQFWRVIDVRSLEHPNPNGKIADLTVRCFDIENEIQCLPCSPKIDR